MSIIYSSENTKKQIYRLSLSLLYNVWPITQQYKGVDYVLADIFD